MFVCYFDSKPWKKVFFFIACAKKVRHVSAMNRRLSLRARSLSAVSVFQSMLHQAFITLKMCLQFLFSSDCSGNKRYKKRSYCGKRSPELVASPCPSGCVSVSFKSGFGGSAEANGFKAIVRAVEKGQ